MVATINQQAWRAKTPLNMVEPLHDFPKNPDMVLPNFELGRGISIEDHLKSFYLDLEILSVEHEYVVCTLFPYNFEPK